MKPGLPALIVDCDANPVIMTLSFHLSGQVVVATQKSKKNKEWNQ
jgi:frataxin-like iron-binding protein CyaY